MPNRFSSFYKQIILQDFALKHTIKNSLEIIKISQVILHFTSSDMVHENTFALNALMALKLLTGQQAAIFTTKKSVAAFKTRKNQLISCQVTLRGKRLFSFLDAFINIVLPRLHTSEIKQLIRQDNLLAEFDAQSTSLLLRWQSNQSGKNTLTALAEFKSTAVYLRNRVKRADACCRQRKAYASMPRADLRWPYGSTSRLHHGSVFRREAEMLAAAKQQSLAPKRQTVETIKQPKQLFKITARKCIFTGHHSVMQTPSHHSIMQTFQKINKISFGVKQLLLFPQLESHFQVFETIKGLDMSIVTIEKQRYSHPMLPFILCSGFQLPIFRQQNT